MIMKSLHTLFAIFVVMTMTISLARAQQGVPLTKIRVNKSSTVELLNKKHNSTLKISHNNGSMKRMSPAKQPKPTVQQPSNSDTDDQTAMSAYTADFWITTVDYTFTEPNLIITAYCSYSTDQSFSDCPLRFYLSTNNSITTSDTPIKTEIIGLIPAGAGAFERTVIVDISDYQGIWYVGAIIDPNNAVTETNEYNNDCAAPNQVTCTSDLQFTYWDISYTYPDLSLLVGIKNIGTITASDDAERVHLDVYLSDNTNIQMSDIHVSIWYFSALSPNEEKIISYPIDISGNEGQEWYVGGIIDEDNDIPETNTGNNKTFDPDILQLLPDFTYVSAHCSYSYSDPNVTMNFRLTNCGNVPSESFSVDFYLSFDNNIRTSDKHIGTITCSGLAVDAHADKSKTVNVSAYNGSNWYVGFIINKDDIVEEINEGSNIYYYPTKLNLPDDEPDNELESPSGLVALDNYDDVIPIAWKAPENTQTLQSYKVFRNTSQNGTYSQIASNITEQYYRDETVSNGQTYYYKIKAVYNSGVSGFSNAANATAQSNGNTISAGYVVTAPTLDGDINTSEWSNASETVFTFTGNSDNVTLYVMNDNSYIYFAVDDEGNTTLDPSDTFGIIFDENHDREWPATDTDEEGILQLYWDGSTTVSIFRSVFGTWPELYGSSWSIASGIDVVMSASSGNLQIEAKLNLSTSPFNVSAGDVLGILFYTREGTDNSFTGMWPQEIEQKLSSLTTPYTWAYGCFGYGDLELAESTSFTYNSLETSRIPEIYTLSQNYPNPFNPITTIQFSLPKSCFVTLKIYDLLGKEIKTLVNEKKSAGEYTVEWNGKHQPSGMYLCQLRVGGLTETRKLMLQR